MITKIRPSRLVLVLIFGLTSCAPDSSPLENQDTQFNVEVINKDQSRFRLQGLKEININNSLDFGFSDQEVQNTKTTSTTQCQKSNSPHKESHQTEFFESTNVEVINLLPVNILTPHSLEKVEIFCDINLQVKRDQKILFEVDLKQLQIKDFENENGLSLNFIESSAITHYLLPQISSAQVLSENRTQKTALHTLCETKQTFKYIESSQAITMTDLLDDSFFANQPIIYCRFLSREEKTKKTTISSSFWLQKSSPEISVSFEQFFNSELLAARPGQKLAEIKLINNSPAPLLVSYRDFFTLVSPNPIYTSAASPQGHSKLSPPFMAGWILKTGLKVIKQGNVDTDTHFILDPGQEMVVELKSQGYLECSSGLFPPPPGSNLRCDQQLILTGIFYKIDFYPQINFNIWHDHSQNDWISKDFNQIIGAQQNPQYSFWSPNNQIKQICEVRNIVTVMEALYQEIHPAFAPGRGCRAYF